MIYIQQWIMRCQWSHDFLLPSTVHQTLTDVHAYIKDHWDKLPDDVPEDYAAPYGDPVALADIAISPELMVKLRNSKYGIKLPGVKNG